MSGADISTEEQAQYYRLLRRVLAADANGDFEPGNKLNEIMREIRENDRPVTEADFDVCMEKALKVFD